MNRFKKAAAALLVVLTLGLTTGCGEVTEWCATYQKGYMYVTTYAIPTLDIASGMTLQWIEQYSQSKTLLSAINEQLTAFCIKHEEGQPVTLDEVTPLVADGTQVLAEIIALYQTFQRDNPEGEVRGLGDRGVDADALYEELMALSQETGARSH